VQVARAQNRELRSRRLLLLSSAELASLTLPTTGDLVRARETRILFEAPCTFGHASSCLSADTADGLAPVVVEETKMVEWLRTSESVKEATALLNGGRYRNSFELLTDLLLRERPDAVLEVMQLDEFQRENLAWYHAFSANAFLAPAFAALANGFYDEGLRQYQRFAAISLAASRKRTWVDRPDLDVSDVAFLSHAFCDDRQASARADCLIGLLSSVYSLSEYRIDPSTEWYGLGTLSHSRIDVSLLPISEAASKYRGLPPQFRHSPLGEYLDAMAAFDAERLTSATIRLDSLRRGETRDAVRRLATYAMLRVRTRMARTQSDFRACEQELRQARSLAAALLSADTTDWFALAAKDRLEGLNDIFC
jgi:hypothetical protein